MNKKVSVVMCTYNGEKYLKEQLDSILNQTHPIQEIYIQDDCSTDGTVHIIEEYKEKYPVIRYSVNKKNKGFNDNFFSALANVNGEYIAISDQDDIWEPEKIACQMDCIENKLLCFCRSIPFSEDGSPIHYDQSAPNFGLERMIFLSVISGHDILLRSELLKKIPQGYNFIYDWKIAMTAAACDSIAFCDKFLCHHRRYTQAATYSKPRNYDKSLRNVFQMFFVSSQIYIHHYDLVTSHYNGMVSFLKDIKRDNEPDFLQGCIDTAKQLGRRSIISFIKASRWCIENRDKIFYKEENNTILSIGRAMFFPILLYQYWDHLDEKQDSNLLIRSSIE